MDSNPFLTLSFATVKKRPKRPHSLYKQWFIKAFKGTFFNSQTYTAHRRLSLGSSNSAPPLTQGWGTYPDLGSNLTHRTDIARHTKVALLDTPIDRADTPSMGVSRISTFEVII